MTLSDHSDIETDFHFPEVKHGQVNAQTIHPFSDGRIAARCSEERFREVDH